MGGVFDENNIWGPGRTQWRDDFSVFEWRNDTVEIWTERLNVHESTPHEVASENILIFHGRPAY